MTINEHRIAAVSNIHDERGGKYVEGDEKTLDICEPCRRQNDPQGNVCSADRAHVEDQLLISCFLEILTSSRQKDC